MAPIGALFSQMNRIYNTICQPQVSFLPTILAIPQFLIKGFPPKEDPKLSFEGNKVHTLLKLFQGESSKQDSVKYKLTVQKVGKH